MSLIKDVWKKVYYRLSANFWLSRQIPTRDFCFRLWHLQIVIPLYQELERKKKKEDKRRRRMERKAVNSEENPDEPVNEEGEDGGEDG